MNGLLRRSFLKVGTALLGSTLVTKYVEAEELILPKNEWVEDRGGHYIVRVPDYKTFEKEQLDKSTIFVLGEGSVVRNVSVQGYMNLSMNKHSIVTRVNMDASKCMMVGRDCLIQMQGQGGMVGDVSAVGNLTEKFGLKMVTTPYKVWM